MYKDAFHRLNESVEASERLIQHTLQAAEQRASHKQIRPWQLAGALAAALCVLVAAVLLQRPAPKDLVASNGELPTATGGFLPLSSTRPDAAQELSITAGAATITENGVISIPITVKGACIQDHVRLDFSHDNSLLSPADGQDQFPQPANEGLFTFAKNYKLAEGKELDDLNGHVNFSVDTVILVDVKEALHRDILLSTLPMAEYETSAVIATNPSPEGGGAREVHGHLVPGEPLIDLGHGCAVSAIGFNEQNQLVVQLRMPAELPWESTCGAFITPSATAQWDWNSLTPWDAYLGWWDDDLSCIYRDFTFAQISPTKLDDIRLATKADPVIAEIKGPWALSAALPTAEPPAQTIISTGTDHLSNPVAQGLLGEHAAELIEAFQPIGLQTSHLDIQLEVIAACLKDGYPVILAAVSGDSVDSLTECLFQLEPAQFTNFHVNSSYDESSRIKYFLTTVTQGTRLHPGDELTLDLYHIRLCTPTAYTIHRDLDLAAHAQHRMLQSVDAIRTDYPEDFGRVSGYIPTQETTASVMTPGEPLLSFPNGSYVSAIGAINGKLRLQTCHQVSNISFIHDGRTVSATDGSILSLSVMPRTAEQYSIDYMPLVESTINWSANGSNYTEYILRVNAEDAADYVLRSTFKGADSTLNGQWKLTFVLPAN